MSKDPENNNFNNEPNDFGLPEDYFQKSAGSILNKIEWLEEHKGFPRLIELKKVPGFVIPQKYFENSEQKLELIGYPALLKLSKETGYDVPQNFFENLEINELSKVLKDEGHELATYKNLNAIDRQNPFRVDEAYFNRSEQKIILSLTKSAKIIRLFGAKTLYSAVAAIIAITLGLWIYNNYFKPVISKDCGTLACVDKTDLIKTKNLENLDDDQLYEIVDTKKLEKKLEKKASEKEKIDADTSLKNISTEELLDEI